MREQQLGPGEWQQGKEEQPRGRSLGAGKNDPNCFGGVVAGARCIFSCCNVCAFLSLFFGLNLSTLSQEKTLRLSSPGVFQCFYMVQSSQGMLLSCCEGSGA